MECVGRKDPGKFFSPFHDNQSGNQVVFPAECPDFGFGFQAVEIKMEKREGRACVFMHQREGGAGDFIRAAQSSGQAADKLGFSGTQRTA